MTSVNTAFTHRAHALGPQMRFRGSWSCGQPPTEVRECGSRYLKPAKGMKNIKIKIRYPLNIKLIVSMLLLLATLYYVYVVSGNISFLSLCTFIVLVIIIAVIRWMLIPRELVFQDSSIKIKNFQIDGNEIMHIYIEGNKVIGIRPKKYKMSQLIYVSNLTTETKLSSYLNGQQKTL